MGDLITPGRRAGQLVLTARRTERLEALRNEILGHNPQLEVHIEPCDLSDTDAVAAFAENIANRLGSVDILVNCAGFGDRAPYDLTLLEPVLL